ncbi:MAG TPA: hypothetical protein GX733_09065 [Tissierellia bacterium]|nr:hypothetical protein [Tissierellia bacterium]
MDFAQWGLAKRLRHSALTREFVGSIPTSPATELTTGYPVVFSYFIFSWVHIILRSYD